MNVPSPTELSIAEPAREAVPDRQLWGDWFVRPSFDLLVVANVPWVLAWLPWSLAATGGEQLSFWQLYFLTVPHRWISLGVAAAERRSRGVSLVAALALGAIVGFWYTQRASLAALVAFDLVASALHYAWQHARVVQAYATRRRANSPWHVLALLAGYANLRLVQAMLGWELAYPWMPRALGLLDGAMLLVAAAVVAFALRGGSSPARGSLSQGARCYLASVAVLYGSVLACLRLELVPQLEALFVSLAAFHATEYLALVSLAVWRKGEAAGSRPGGMAKHWLLILAACVLGMGVVSAWADRAWSEPFLAFTLWISLTHYVCDAWHWRAGFFATGGSTA